MTADRVAATFLLAFAVFVIFEARSLPFWTANAPGPGFLPFWLGVLLALAAVVMLTARAVPQTLPDRSTTIRLAAIVGMTAAAAALGLVIGLVLASGVFMGATLAYLRPAHTRANLVATVLAPAVVWLVFVRWLSVPLPVGPLGF
jgi:putative tricarboxylic transport membrane protein